MSDYNLIDSLLARVEAEAMASECHGFLCGQICGTGTADADLWQEFIDVQGEDEDLIQTCYAEIGDLVGLTCEQMQSPEFGLELLLPGDDTSMTLRVEALAEWCHGFLNGFGVSEGVGAAGLSPEVEAVLEDYSRICRLTLEEDEDEDEQALMELVEYARLGAIMIFDELQATHGRPEALH